MKKVITACSIITAFSIINNSIEAKAETLNKKSLSKIEKVNKLGWTRHTDCYGDCHTNCHTDCHYDCHCVVNHQEVDCNNIGESTVRTQEKNPAFDLGQYADWASGEYERDYTDSPGRAQNPIERNDQLRSTLENTRRKIDIYER